MELTEEEMREIHADFSHFASNALVDMMHRMGGAPEKRKERRKLPNYCVGQMRIRGKTQNIGQFLIYEVETYNYSGGISMKPTLDLSKRRIEVEHGDGIILWLGGDAYIEGTKRNFFEPGEYYAYEMEDGTAVLVVNFFSAWRVDISPYLGFSKKYELGFRLYAFEKLQRFNRDIWVENGKILKDDTITFNDYEWECIAPLMGG